MATPTRRTAPLAGAAAVGGAGAAAVAGAGAKGSRAAPSEAKVVKAAKLKMAQLSTASMGRVRAAGLGLAHLLSRGVPRWPPEDASQAVGVRARTVPASRPPQFDRALSGEPALPKDPRRIKRMPNEAGHAVERARDTDILRRVLGGSGEGEAKRSGGGGGGGGSGGSATVAGVKRRRG